MKSLKDWRIKENTQNIEWDHVKSMKFSASPDMKAFVMPRIEKLQEAIVHRLSQGNPKIESFRDVPPEVRDQFAQAIVAATLETFFSSMDPQPNQGAPAIQPQMPQQQQQLLPQDEPKTPAASRG